MPDDLAPIPSDAAMMGAAVAAQTEQLQRVLDQASGFICILRGPDHVYELVNRAYSRLVRGREVLGRTVADAIPEAVEQGFIELLDRVWATGETVVGRQAPLSVSVGPDMPAELRYIDFAFKPLTDAAGRITGIFAEGSDVSDARRAEVTRQENEAWIRGIGETMPGFLWSADRDGRLTQTSTPWLAFAGGTAEDTLGDGWADFVHPDDRPRVRAAWADCIASGRVYNIEFRVRRQDGVYSWALVRATPLRDAAEAVTGWAGLLVDIDDQKRAEAALHALNETLEQRIELAVAERERAEDALRQAQKMEAIGQLTGGIAHDFNNMLQGVIGSLELMRRRIEQGRIADVTPLIDLAAQGADRAATLTRRLLGFARRQMLHDRAVDPNALVAGMAELVGRTVGPGVDVRVELGAVAWPVLCDANQLESAVLNLAINARDAMPDGGVLTLSTAARRLAASGPGAAEAIAGGDYAEIAVADTGTGMLPEIAAQAFEPFFTTKPIGQGTGLGLSQLYGFVRQSGGTVRLETAPGAGTTVRLFLPRDLAGSSVAAAVSVAGTPTVARGRILLVEDERSIRSLAAEALGEIGCVVTEAADGPSALRALDAGLAIDALVTDVGLPGGIDGHQLAEAARRRRRDLPVLFITGFAGSVADGQLASGMTMIGKPFTLDELTRAVTDMLAGR